MWQRESLPASHGVDSREKRWVGTWTLKANVDWEGLFTQVGLLQQGHRNQPTSLCRSYMFLDQQLEGGAWTAFPLGESFGNTTENKPCAISKQHFSHRFYPRSTQIVSQINCHPSDMKEGKWRFPAEHTTKKTAGQQLQEGAPSGLREFTFKNTEKMWRHVLQSRIGNTGKAKGELLWTCEDKSWWWLPVFYFFSIFSQRLMECSGCDEYSGVAVHESPGSCVWFVRESFPIGLLPFPALTWFRPLKCSPWSSERMLRVRYFIKLATGESILKQALSPVPPQHSGSPMSP